MKKYDLEDVIRELEAGEEEVFVDEESRFAECPHCGSDTWNELRYTKKGKAVRCNECISEQEQ
jgi:predicted RNA-binding Zn-ribbon protein involved in translation (DUF1610 family)